LHKALHKIAIAAHHAHQPSRTPDDDMQKKNLSLIVRYAHPRVWERFLTLLDADNIPFDSMPYNDFAQWIFKAERPPSAKSAIVAFVNSISINSPPLPIPSRRFSSIFHYGPYNKLITTFFLNSLFLII
jgi:hypothetical protein